jgi:proteasome accessory factor B
VGGVNPEDRLFHLILALMSTTYGLTKEQILQSVRGYREDTERGLSRESLERRFERDKDALRELGIPLEVTIPLHDDGNNKNSLYRIPKGDYDLPDDVEFTPRDITLLNLSAALWREGSLSQEARLAQIKLASFGVTVTETLIGYAPVISTSDPALSALQKAIDHSQKVRFDYLKPGDTAGSTRIVSPWALVNHEGRWHLYAHEDSSEKAKTFLLRRIVSSVVSLKEAGTESGDDVAARAISGLDELYRTQSATLEIIEGSDAWSVLSTRAGTVVSGQTCEVHFTDIDIFADELTSLGRDVRVIGPEDLVAKVVANLQALVGNHG